MIRWGTVTTTNAPLSRILDFAAWHLELGAHRLYIYLDAADPEAQRVLSAHPRIRVLTTDATWWEKRGRRPDKHQARQARNARHANNRKPETEWLAHIDVDEFLLPRRPLAEQLRALPDDCLCARVRPVEALAPAPGGDSPSAADFGPGAGPAETLFKAFHLDQQDRQRAAEACFPTWGRHLSGGFLSHVAGKLFFRPGTDGLDIRIHNVTLGEVTNPGERSLPETELGHFHAGDWPHFLSAYRFRMAQGSYRAELKPQVRGKQAVSLHALLAMIEEAGGEEALRAFYDEVCTATPELTARLEAEGLLRRRAMDLPALRARHFPGVVVG